MLCFHIAPLLIDCANKSEIAGEHLNKTDPYLQIFLRFPSNDVNSRDIRRHESD
jgi:hypothetical protein